MSRLAKVFKMLRAERRCALVTYVMAGDPLPETTVPLLHALVAQGADIIELGVPFSDPMADGPVIQLASERALRHDVSLRTVLAMATEFRKQNMHTPLVLMGYANPLEVMGYAAFVAAAKQADIDGLITVDLPPEEEPEFFARLKANNIDPLFLLSPTTTEARIKTICAVASGFVYYVSLKGVTGAASLNVQEVATKLNEIRDVTDLPLGVGFGIKDAASARAVAKVADAVVVGSALVKLIEQHAQEPQRAIQAAAALVSELRAALPVMAKAG